MASLQPNMFTTPPHPRAGGSNDENGSWASPTTRLMGPPPSPSPSTSGPFRPVPRAHWVQSTPPDQTGVAARTRSMLVPSAPVIPDARAIQAQSHTIRSQRDLWQEEERLGMPGIEVTYDQSGHYPPGAGASHPGQTGDNLSWMRGGSTMPTSSPDPFAFPGHDPHRPPTVHIEPMTFRDPATRPKHAPGGTNMRGIPTTRTQATRTRKINRVRGVGGLSTTHEGDENDPNSLDYSERERVARGTFYGR